MDDLFVRFRKSSSTLYAMYMYTDPLLDYESKEIPYNEATAKTFGWDPNGPREQLFAIEWKWVPYFVKEELSWVG